MLTYFIDKLNSTGIVRKATTTAEATSPTAASSLALVPKIEGAAAQAQARAETRRERRGEKDPLARVYSQLARARRHIASRLSARASLSRDGHR